MGWPVGRLRLTTEIATGGFVLSLVLTTLFASDVASTTLPRITYLIVATVVLFVVSTLLLVNDLVGGQ